ncbi:plasmalemma vesicle associated protein b [Aplochiton taeniatus]
MYSNNYSRAKFGLEARDIHKPKGKSCGYYMKVVFFFSSLIQSLIIVSLVLFLVYGQPEKTAEQQRVKDLESGFNALSETNIKLRKEKGELSSLLGVRTGEKAALVKEVATLKTAANTSAASQKTLQSKLSICEIERKKPKICPACPAAPVINPVINTANSEVKTLQTLNAQQVAMLKLVQANFTQTIFHMSGQRDSAVKDRDSLHLEAISLRRDNANLKEQLTTYTRKCKEDFAKSLEGIQMVTTAFLGRINNLFPHQMTFHLTCEKQQEQMEKIRTRCTSLSKEVEDKFQSYLDSVGNQVSNIQAQSSRLEVQNTQTTIDLQQCENNRSVTVAESNRRLQECQESQDRQVEALLKEQKSLREDKSQQGKRLALKEAEVNTLNGQIQTLTAAKANCNVKVR